MSRATVTRRIGCSSTAAEYARLGVLGYTEGDTMKKTYSTLLTVAIACLFLIQAASAILVEEGVRFETPDTNTTFIAGKNFTFDLIEVHPTYLRFDGNTLSANPSSGSVEVTINEFDISKTAGEILISFEVSADGGSVSFTLCNLTADTYYVIKKDSGYLETEQSDASGCITFIVGATEEYDLTIQEAKPNDYSCSNNYECVSGNCLFGLCKPSGWECYSDSQCSGYCGSDHKCHSYSTGGGGGGGGGATYGAIPKPSCFDGIENCHDGSCEEGIDCGGPCRSCPTCSDGIQNQGEEGIDCGGPCDPCLATTTTTTIIVTTTTVRETTTTVTVPEETTTTSTIEVPSVIGRAVGVYPEGVAFAAILIIALFILYLLYKRGKKEPAIKDVKELLDKNPKGLSQKEIAKQLGEQGLNVSNIEVLLDDAVYTDEIAYKRGKYTEK
jgi:hypothetical protein